MDLMLYRSRIKRLLSKETTEVKEEVKRRIDIVLELLGTEEMSIEGAAIITAQVKIEKEGK